ncbi:dimethylargininase [Egicoccus sp. AB-alg2]|uniref:dimethylargininase n=1 Tax=Egicoccus sp. AB-alg2 TaxID=3242693 RepID=UPI00359DE3F9
MSVPAVPDGRRPDVSVADGRQPPLMQPAPEQTDRQATRRRFLMTPPTHFEVAYAINAWMDPSAPVDRQRAIRQWEDLVAVYESLGHDVVRATPAPGLPDMVFAANGGVVVGGIAVGARFATPQRAPEAALYREALSDAGIEVVHEPSYVNEGEGDYVVVGDTILAGTGFRTDIRAHAELARLTGREVVSLRLVDPRFYHLDVAVFALDDDNVAYYPGAFDDVGRAELARRYPDAIVASEQDALVLGLNAVSDGRHVVVAHEADHLVHRLAERGYVPIPIDLSELRKSGGGVKCCTLELRPAPETPDQSLGHEAFDLHPAPGAYDLHPAPGVTQEELS